jgi:hypothetical protein
MINDNIPKIEELKKGEYESSTFKIPKPIEIDEAACKEGKEKDPSL